MKMNLRFCAALLCAAMAAPAVAQDLQPIQLPKPRITGGKPLMEALALRSSAREFGPEKLGPQVLSDMLWAAWGFNRPDAGKRTAPSSTNRQEIDVYVATAEGAYLYDAKANRLQPVAAGDLRAATGTQPYVGTAALNLVYVADYARMAGSNDQAKAVTAAVNTGFISQNVYLYCASEGLATVVRGSVNRDELAKALKLRPEQHVTYAQSVGYPKK
ncbi:MAG: SagB/ThcOx family dehydrogenase [Bryobacteraceae bacterium]